MKTLLCLISLALTNVASLSAAESVADLFREGLFEEEANRNLPAAIQAYEEVVERLDEQRRLAATAVFRLGECYRKLGRTDEAITAYERILREFPAEDTLTKLSRENLSLLRPTSPAALLSLPSLSSSQQDTARSRQRELLLEEIALVEQALAAEERRVSAGVGPRSALLPVQRDLLTLQRQLAASQRPPTELGSTSTLPTPLTNEEVDEIRRIQALVANSPDLINAPGEYGTTELMNAARNGRVAVVLHLLDHGARVDAARNDGQIALPWAVAEGHLRVAELLLERGASVDAATRSGRTPLFEAAQKGYRELAKLLLSKGAEVNATMTSTEKPPGAVFGGTPLWTAVANQQTAMAELLLSHGADPNLTGGDAGTPLSAADAPELVRLLLDNGADPKRGRGQTVGEGDAEE